MEALQAAALTNLDMASVSEYPSGVFIARCTQSVPEQRKRDCYSIRSLPYTRQKLTRSDWVRDKLLATAALLSGQLNAGQG